MAESLNETCDRCGTELVEREFPRDRMVGPPTVWVLYCPKCKHRKRDIT